MENATLASQSRSALLGLYSLDARLGRAQSHLAALAAEARTLRGQQASLRQQLSLARRDTKISQQRLESRLRLLYEQHDVSTLEVIFGAKSLDEAMTGLENLDRVSRLDQQVLAQLESARGHLTSASGTLDARIARLRASLQDAQATAASLAQAKAERAGYLSSLSRRRDLNSAQISQLTAQARAAASRTQELTRSVSDTTVSTTSAAVLSSSAPAPAAQAAASAPVPASSSGGGGRTITVTATGYALAGTTATGIPVGWGVAAVDPRVIPLGSHMTIPGYGEAVAADTGGAVIGGTIDLWFPSVAQAQAWGRRTITITLH